MLKLTERQKEKLANLISANQMRFALRPAFVPASGGCNSCNGTCQASCGGCSQGCGSTNACLVTIL